MHQAPASGMRVEQAFFFLVGGVGSPREPNLGIRRLKGGQRSPD